MAARPSLSPVHRDVADDGDDERVLSLRLAIDAASQRPLIGLTLIDAFTHRIHVGQTLDTDRFHSLLSLVSLHQPQTVLLALDRNVPNYISERISIAVKTDDERRRVRPLKYSETVIDDTALSAALTPILSDGSSVYLLSQSQPHAFASVYSALTHCRLIGNTNEAGRWRLTSIDFHSHLSVDLSAMTALNLFPSPNDSSSEMSLFGLLNKGRSVMASRLLTTWIKQPLLSLEQIQRRQSLIAILLSNYSLRAKLRDGALKRMPDFDKLIRMFQRGRAGLQQIIVLWQFTQRLPAIIDALGEWDCQGHEADKELLQTVFADRFDSMTESFRGIDQMVHTTIDLEAINRHEFLINAKFNPTLMALAEERDSVMAAMQEECDAVSHTVGLEGKVRINDSTQHGYYLRCSQSDERDLRGQRSIIVIETRKDGTKFTTPTFRRMSSQYKQVNESYIDTQSELVSKAVEVVNSYLPLLEEASNLIGELDLYCALAHVFDTSAKAYVRPTLLPMTEHCLSLAQARHPCMELVSGNFIANDVEINGDDRRTLVITGPNMSGKSSFIRSVAVIQLMAQCGFYVPCETATLSVRDRIFTRIGAGDAQLKGMSTFYKEMSESSTILAQATENSLVVIDELGRGTSTRDGLGLAMAITLHLNDSVRCASMIATHYHELTELESQRGVANLHCEVLLNDSEGSIVMTHRVKHGAIGQSYGVHCAAMAKLPQEIVDNARVKAEELEAIASTECVELSPEVASLLSAEEVAAVKRLLAGEQSFDDNLAQKLLQIQSTLTMHD